MLYHYLPVEEQLLHHHCWHLLTIQTAGELINPITKVQYLDKQYSPFPPSNSVSCSFYPIENDAGGAGCWDCCIFGSIGGAEVMQVSQSLHHKNTISWQASLTFSPFQQHSLRLLSIRNRCGRCMLLRLLHSWQHQRCRGDAGELIIYIAKIWYLQKYCSHFPRSSSVPCRIYPLEVDAGGACRWNCCWVCGISGAVVMQVRTIISIAKMW